MSEKEIHQLQKEMKALGEAMGGLTKAMEAQQKAIQPMIDVYETFGKLGSYGTRFLKGLILILTAMSLILGVIFALKKGQR